MVDFSLNLQQQAAKGSTGRHNNNVSRPNGWQHDQPTQQSRQRDPRARYCTVLSSLHAPNSSSTASASGTRRTVAVINFNNVSQPNGGQHDQPTRVTRSPQPRVHDHIQQSPLTTSNGPSTASFSATSTNLRRRVFKRSPTPKYDPQHRENFMEGTSDSVLQHSISIAAIFNRQAALLVDERSSSTNRRRRHLVIVLESPNLALSTSARS